jgi:CheY-like chemotaxis protein
MQRQQRVLTVGKGQLFGFEMTPEREASLGISVDSFSDPFSALDQLAAREYDLVLVDIRMPSMNGLQFARAAKKASPKTRIALLLLTAHNSIEKDKAELPPGVDAFLAKPVTAEAFTELLGKKAPLVYDMQAQRS